MVEAPIIRCVIVTVPERQQMRDRLARYLRGSGVIVNAIVDEHHEGALANHRGALALGSTCDHLVVMEDDAIPCKGFTEMVASWVKRKPNDLVSYYLGTGRPPQYMRAVDAATKAADWAGTDYIQLPTLIHGVCYSMPGNIASQIAGMLHGDHAADFAIGAAWTRLTGRQVVYTWPSIVDHADVGSVERHRDGAENRGERHARRLVGPCAIMRPDGPPLI